MARNLEGELAFADAMLARWAEWGRGGTLGWPPRTLLAKVIDEGFTGAAQAAPTPEMGEAVEVVERAVLRLKPIQRRVLVVYYTRWQPREAGARYCRMSEGQFTRLLHEGRRRVADYLEGFSLRNSHSI